MNHRICIALLVLAALCGIAAAATDSVSDASSQISVTGITKSPETLMPGDQGFITVTITNSGDESASIDRVKLYTNDLTVVNDNAYDVVGDIGAGNSMEFSFMVEAGPAEGIFYPAFYIDFGSSGSLRSSIPVIVEDTTPQVSLLGVPETFTEGKTVDITVLVGNPREGKLSAITITPVTDGIKSDQTSYFVGNLEQDESAEVTFAITPEEEGDLSFEVSYRNGVNEHTTTVSTPMTFGTDKTSAVLVVNEVSVSSSGSTATVSGDVTNAGLEDAYSVMVTVGDPATPANPNPVAVLGALEPDDFSGFEVTYTMQGAGQVPVLVTYKDEDGNIYEEEFYVTGSSGTATTDGDGTSTAPDFAAGGPGGDRNPLGSMGSGFAQIPVIPIIFVLLIIGGGLIAWRTGHLAQARDTIRARLHKEK
ncbi:COG1361 family protein [Methanogenium organophilum]|uniref:CARDB domain-containing protein n=1 Tax=Methanogenium organophilum TaxID=2199 RepID=A0A9X9S6G9_METOG|nr:hypothetical protein [Methanogenium organophilum]WAI01775.1 hypothetical protein OU421_02560 [Methanogenium organophilum]